MVRTARILLIFATIATQELPSWQRENRWYPVSSGNMSVTTIYSHLYTVSKSKSHINIQSDDTTYDECNLELNDIHIGKIQIASIERKILLLYRQSSTSIRMLQLDPFLCIYTPLPSLPTTDKSTAEPRIIVINNTLDIFLTGTRNCLPYRMDRNGKQLEVNGQLAQADSPLFESFVIDEFIQEEQLGNYVFAGNFKNGSSTLILLDHNFNVTKEIYFEYHQVEALAANSGSTNQTWIGITYAGLGNPHERILALYTGALEMLFETRLKKHQTDLKIIDTLLSINSDGYSCIYSVQMPLSSPSPLPTWRRHMNYAIYDSEGHVQENKEHTDLLDNIPFHWQLLQHRRSFCYALYWFPKEFFDSRETRSDILCSDAIVSGR